MTSHAACQHPATAAARASCRKSRARVAEIRSLPEPWIGDSQLAKAEARTAKLGITIPHTDAVKPEGMSDVDWHLLLRNNARFTDLPFPTDEERAASLTKVWCTTCHLLHEQDDPCSGAARRVATAAPASEAPAARPSVAGQDLLPTFANARELASSIPQGRYAVRDVDGTVKFYKLDKPTEGRWAGYVFLKIQASDEFHPIKLAARQIAVYGAILDAGVKESSALYGHSLGSCGVCGRTLTDAESIAAGIGPKCAAKMGW